VGNGSVWFLSRGWVAPNLLSRLGLLSLLPAAAATLLAARMAAGSLPRPLPQPSVSALAGFALFAAMIFYKPDPDYAAQLWRAGIYGAYSGGDPSRQELRLVVLSAKTPAERRQALGAWRAYGAPE